MPVKYVGYDLLNRYGMIHKFKVPSSTLETFLSRIEEGRNRVWYGQHPAVVSIPLCLTHGEGVKRAQKGFGNHVKAHKIKVHKGIVELLI